MTSEYLARITDNKKYALGAGLVAFVMIFGFLAQNSVIGLSSGAGNDATEQLAGSQPTSGGSIGYAEADGSSGAVKRDVAGSSGGSPDVENRKRITNIYIDFEVPDAMTAQSEAKNMAEMYGGYTDSESYNRNNGDTAQLTARIPEGNVSDFLSQAESNWEIESRNRNTNDVTDQYTQLELELENKRQEMSKLQEIMNDTNDTENLIKIQERMSELRSRIQYLENQMENIDERVDYTRVDMSFKEPESLTAEFEIDEAVRDSLRGIFQSLNLIIVGIGYLMPFALLGLLIHFGRKTLRAKE